MIPEITISNSIKHENQFHKLEYNGYNGCKYLVLPCIKSNVLLHGYFQSEMYFPKGNYFLSSFINNFIIPRKSITPSNKYFIHVRMGDYINNNFHYVGYKKYLKNSINYIKLINSKAEFIIFSNERDKTKLLAELGSELANEKNFSESWGKLSPSLMQVMG